MTRSVRELDSELKCHTTAMITNGMLPMIRPEATGRRSDVPETPRLGQAEANAEGMIPACADAMLPAMELALETRVFFGPSSARRRRGQDW